jgi:hypothetical protein
MAKPKRPEERMDEDDLTALIRSEIDDATQYDSSELSNDREKAERYYNGELPDIEIVEGRSSVTSRDVSDTIEWILPGLMRVFMSTDRLGVCQPTGVSDTQFAKDATAYLAYKFVQLDGYLTLWSALHDMLLHGNGVIKHWWEPADESDIIDTFSGLAEDQYQALLMELKAIGGDVIAQSVRQYGPMTYYDVKTSRPGNHCGKLCMMPVPPEEFLLERSATSIKTATFMAHRRTPTRSELIEEGYDREAVEELPTYILIGDDQVKQARDEDALTNVGRDVSDAMRERVEIYEAYIKVDYDGDGITEWRQCVYGGSGESEKLLRNEEWHDDIPFTDLVGMPVPHRWRGRSIFDSQEDIQQIKTVLMRQTLDNLYATNNPMLEAKISNIRNPDILANPPFGAIIDVKENGSVVPIEIPFVAQNSFGMLEYLDTVSTKRTGVGRQSMALDADALANQTAKAAQLQADASYSKIELIARNCAEIGLKQLFRALLRLVVKHQDQPEIIRVRDRPFQARPNLWSPDMDITIELGLGAGSKERDVAVLNAILAKQETAMSNLGPGNPVCGLAEYSYALQKFVESSGFRNSDRFFKEVTPEIAAQFEQQEKEKPSPEQQKAQADGQIEMQKIQMQTQAQVAMEQERSKVQIAKEQAQAQADMITAAQKADMDKEARDQEFMREIEKIRAEAKVRIYEIQEKSRLEREKMAQERTLELLKLGVQVQGMQMDSGHKDADRAAGAADSEADREHEMSIVDAEGFGVPTKGGMDGNDVAGDLFNQIAVKMAGQLAEVMGKQMSEMVNNMTARIDSHSQSLMETMNAEREIVRGPDGRPSGVRIKRMLQ